MQQPANSLIIVYPPPNSWGCNNTQNNNCSGHPVGGTATAQDLTQTNKILCSRFTPHRIKGFTLIELSIVMVIIGLIIGGVLVGQDLINAATIRAQISQIEKYQTAVYTFQLKYGYLPGDMPATVADSYGFWSGTNFGCNPSSTTGQRNGNGLVDSYLGAGSYAFAVDEPSWFWEDLGNSGVASSYQGNQNINHYGAGLIDFTYSGTVATCMPIPLTLGGGGSTFFSTPSDVKYYIPQGKIGKNNYVYVYFANGFNYFGLIVPLTSITNFSASPSFGITPLQAYNIDSKIDDGIATTGNVQASYIGIVNNTYCAATNGSDCTAPPTTYAPTTALEPTKSTSCYNSDTNAYSTKLYPNSPNCALSFKFQ